MPGLEEPKGQVQIFHAGQFWNSNVCGAAVGGAGAGILFLVVMGITVWGNPTPRNILFSSSLTIVVIASAVCLVPGNLIAAYPYAVYLREGKGLELHAPLKKVFIPVEDLRDVRKTFLQPGYILRMKRRHRLLKSFLIPRYFGHQAEPLANAIQLEIQRSVS